MVNVLRCCSPVLLRRPWLSLHARTTPLWPYTSQLGRPSTLRKHPSAYASLGTYAKVAKVSKVVDSMRPPGMVRTAYMILLAFGSMGAVSYCAVWSTNEVTFFHRCVLGIIKDRPEFNGQLQDDQDGVLAVARGIRMTVVDAISHLLSATTARVLPALGIMAVAKVSASLEQLFTDYYMMPDGRRMTWNICTVNTLLWGCWRLRSVSRLPTWFLYGFHNPMSTRNVTLFTSIFFHTSLPHLIACNLAILILGEATAGWMQQEQGQMPGPLSYESTPKYHFLFFCTAAGIISAATSTIAFRAFGYRQLLANIAVAPIVGSLSARSVVNRLKTFFTPSYSRPQLTEMPAPVTYGASGLAYALATVSAISPHTHISVNGNNIPVTALQWGLGVALLADVVGAMAGWRRLDHWAHLGGAAFGALYYAYGMQRWAEKRSADWTKETDERLKDMIAAGKAEIDSGNK
ncbi:hypothetical protein FA95DRAFT_1676293 [Auriscalpium vulgare]|uniref:Uncharacterized protein n=1 Tax=Auriscalpium vulgare TaxID=40419 RepID=A0ACB8S3J0_9AGAM|nr:hypothetical protein FA95DRAFT_1676293 [Auriscalpium vulgare]